MSQVTLDQALVSICSRVQKPRADGLKGEKGLLLLVFWRPLTFSLLMRVMHKSRPEAPSCQEQKLSGTVKTP